MTKTKTRLYLLLIFAVILITFPWVIVRFSGISLTPIAEMLLTGIAIVGAAFLISWAAELAQFDVPRSFALAGLALIAMLPEYAVDIYLAWEAGKNPSYISYVSANMTGANRLLIGIGWSLVVIFSWWASRKKQTVNPMRYAVTLEKDLYIEFVFLAMATVYCFILPIKSRISLWDSGILILIYLGYLWMAFKSQHHEPEPEGPVELLAKLPKLWRRLVELGLFMYAAFIILIATEPFTESLITVGNTFGISEFLLIQWIAPIASESPELIVIAYFALRGFSSSAMTAVVSSKINQWTLLIASLPIAFTLSSKSGTYIHLDPRPREEVLLTAAQSFFALAVITNLKISLWEAILLLFLFISQLLIPSMHVRYLYCGIYILLGLIWMVKQNQAFRQNLKSTWQALKSK
ncbi:MAG: sodium:calcium antiporter [bacterium]